MAAFLTALAGAATAATGAAFSAVRWSFSAVISALSLALRSFSLVRLALILAMALAVLETTGAFLAATGLAAGLAAAFATGLAAAFATGLTALAGAALTGFVAALGASFFAVAMIDSPSFVFGVLDKGDANIQPLLTCIGTDYQRSRSSACKYEKTARAQGPRTAGQSGYGIEVVALHRQTIACLLGQQRQQHGRRCRAGQHR